MKERTLASLIMLVIVLANDGLAAYIVWVHQEDPDTTLYAGLMSSAISIIGIVGALLPDMENS